MSSNTLSTDAQPDALAMARSVILDPAGLAERDLEQVLDSVLSHAVDTADLYFQVSHEESWAMEDSIVKEGSASIESGVGVRAITGGAPEDEAALEFWLRGAGEVLGSILVPESKPPQLDLLAAPPEEPKP
jgi:TldD protein